ncbi:hypothetical protein D3C85_372670 [compost metagenome]
MPCVITPALPGGTAPCTPTTICPPGASIWMSPPKSVCTPEGPYRMMSPVRTISWPAASRSGNSVAIMPRPRR